MKEKKVFVKKENINPLVLKAVDMIKESKQSIADTIGKTTMIFTKIKNLESIPATETLGALRLAYGLNINALIDGDADNLFSELSMPVLLKQLESSQKELEESKAQTEFYKKIIEQQVNFQPVYTSNQFVDNIDAFFNMDELTKNAWIGQAFYADIVGRD